MTPEFIQSIAELTHYNEHGKAYQRIAKAIGDQELTDIFAHINSEHQRLGYLSDVLNRQRHLSYQRLMKRAKEVLSLDQCLALYQAT